MILFIGVDFLVGIRLVIIYLINEEYFTIGVKRYIGNKYCKIFKFVWMIYGFENYVFIIV